jgi:hypothetical protein
MLLAAITRATQNSGLNLSAAEVAPLHILVVPRGEVTRGASHCMGKYIDVQTSSLAKIKNEV